MLSGEFVHGSMDHADLRGIAVNKGNLPALLYKISHHLGSADDSSLLLRQIGTEGMVSQGDDYALFGHGENLLSVRSFFYIIVFGLEKSNDFMVEWYNGGNSSGLI